MRGPENHFSGSIWQCQSADLLEPRYTLHGNSEFRIRLRLNRLPSVVTATISLLIPVFASAFAFVLLGERVPSTAIPGSVMVVGGIVMILRQNNQGRQIGSSFARKVLR
jgi:drug/metabolite transporter (DMT)-like permease